MSSAPITIARGVTPEVEAFARDILSGKVRAPLPIARSAGGDRVGVLIHCAEEPEPAPRGYVLEGLIPDGCVTSLYADGGQGKSFLSTALAMHITTGTPFAGLRTARRNVVYMDSELDADEFMRRMYRLSRGMGLAKPPEGIFYYRLPGPIPNPEVMAGGQAVIDAADAGFVVLDSYTIATYGSDAGAQQDTTGAFKALETWGVPILALDHIAKQQAGANHSHASAFGSVFKKNMSRSVLQLIRAEGGGVVLRQTKHNFGPNAEPLNLAYTFGIDAVTISAIAATDERMAGMDVHLPAVERVAVTLHEYPEGVTPETLAGVLEMSAKTVRNHLTVLKQRGHARAAGDGKWTPFPIPDAGRESGMAEEEDWRNTPPF